MSDTTALTTLMKAGIEHLLEKLFGEVIVPQAVADELALHHAALPSWCRVRSVRDPGEVRALCERLDIGEAEAIRLAIELKADVILVDEKKGRREAEALGLLCLALPAMLVQAKRRQLITSVREALRLLEQKGRYKVRADAERLLLESVGEAG